ncbi:hypothetical protein ACQ5SK_42975 [Bradyrhizobium japonicum]
MNTQPQPPLLAVLSIPEAVGDLSARQLTGNEAVNLGIDQQSAGRQSIHGGFADQLLHVEPSKSRAHDHAHTAE